MSFQTDCLHVSSDPNEKSSEASPEVPGLAFDTWFVLLTDRYVPYYMTLVKAMQYNMM